jgi:ribonuclease-3
MTEKEISFIEGQIGYVFKNKELLIQAFTRRSFSEENGGENNEVLEFIGDKALDIIVVRILSEKYGHFSRQERNWNKWGQPENAGTYSSELSEGQLTELKKRMVQKTTLADAIGFLGISDFLIVGKGDELNDVRESTSVKEDLFEAIVGAIALDSEWDIAKLQDSICVMLNPDEIMEDDEINYVSEIQNWSLNHSGTIPLYRFGSCSMQTQWYTPKHELCKYGDAKQDTHFSCELQFQGVKYHFVGYGRSKSLARKEASRLAYEYLEKNDLLSTIRDEIENPNYDESISQLEILARRGYFSLPTYDFEESHDSNGNPIWDCECHIEDVETTTKGKSSLKKDAKKQAAFKMLQHVLEEG